MASWVARVCAPIVLLVAFAADAHAQPPTTGGLAGIVRDATGQSIPRASVLATHIQRQQPFETTTDAAGRFRLPILPAGTYGVRIAATGFTASMREVTIGVGAQLELDVVLPVAGVAENVTVASRPDVVELSRTSLGGRVSPAEIESLPLNGRNYLDLALLTPGVSRTIARTTERFAETSAVPGTGISVSGQRNVNNTFVVDGLSANDDAAGLAGTFFSHEVIQEFQVVTSGGEAEFGRASAGAVNIVTQSGTDVWRQRVYGFFRDDALDARNAFAGGRDPFSQAQFGGTVGGPVRHGRTFVFANVERTDQDRTGFVTIAPPAVASIAQVLSASGYAGAAPGTGAYAAGYRTSNVFVRVDHRLAPSSMLNVRYGLYDLASDNARNVGGLNDVTRGTSLGTRDQSLTANSLVTAGSGLTNDLRAQVSRSRLTAPANERIGPSINVSGVASFGPSTSSPELRLLDVVEVADMLGLQRGRHFFKVGADLLYNDLTIDFPATVPGVYTFSSLANLASGRWSTYQQAFGEVRQALSNVNAALFAQDEWRAGASITLNAGIRYDLQDLPASIRTDRNNLSPRLGLAWAPGDRRTLVRASAGLYTDRIPLRAVSNALQRDGEKYKVAVYAFGQAGAPVFPQVLSEYPSQLVTAITSIAPDIQAATSRQAGIQVERQLHQRVSATLAYQALRGSNIIMSRNVNAPTLSAADADRLGVPNLGRPDPRFANIGRFESIGTSQYDGLSAELQMRSPRWGDTRASYTLSRALDDAGNAFFSTPQNNQDVHADWGPSDNDQRHRVTISGTLDPGRVAGVSHPLFNDWSASWLFAYGSPPPFNVQTGNDRNNDTTVNDRPEGVGRNSARGFDSMTLDVRLAKRLRFGRVRASATLDVFNVLNRTNLLIPNNVFGTGAAPLAAFGQATAAGDPRQVQVGVRVEF